MLRCSAFASVPGYKELLAQGNFEDICELEVKRHGLVQIFRAGESFAGRIFERMGPFSRSTTVPLFCKGFSDPEESMRGLAHLPQSALHHRVHVLSDQNSGVGKFIYVGDLGLLGGGDREPPSSCRFYGAENTDALIISYEDSEIAQSYAAQMIFGGIGVKGKLPVTPSPIFHEGAGTKYEAIGRFKYTIPEELGIDSKILAGIDQHVNKGLKEKAFPGCQVLVAKEGKVIFQKSYGYQTYEKEKPIKNDDIYDLASVTKIASSVAAVMKLQDQGKFYLDYSLCDYLPEFVDNKEQFYNMTLREILAHQAGLPSWAPFFQKTLTLGVPRYDVYSLGQSDIYPFRVADGMYIHRDYRDSMLTRVLASPLKGKGTYKYSDLGYYLIQRIVEKESGLPLNEFVNKNYYAPLGMSTTTYRPKEKFDLDRIVPTEKDNYFRRQLIHGDVHDPGAAMMGGVAGHAGLFSSANDLAKLMQLFMDGGKYGGEQILNPGILEEYTHCQYCSTNRRGAGFDKPVKAGGGPTFHGISLESFGHTGFTGTIAWADPEEEVVYIFLSNRVYPSANNKKLIKMGTRTHIQKVIYTAVEKAVDLEEPVLSTTDQ